MPSVDFRTLASAYPAEAVAHLARHAQAASLPVGTVLALAQQVAATDERFSGAIHDPALARLWSFPARKDDLAALDRLRPAQRQRLAKRIGHDLVGLVRRPPVAVAVEVGGSRLPAYQQRACHLAHDAQGAVQLGWDRTLSSAAARHDERRENGHLRQHLAHAHAVTAGSRLVAFRSGRSDTEAKLYAKVTSAAAAALEANGGNPAGATGWHRGAEGWAFTPTLITAMDRSLVKHLALVIKRLFGGERSERQRLGQLAAAHGALFGAGSLSVTIRTADGGRQDVAIAAPRMVNVVLSGQSAGAENIRQARLDNQARMLPFFADLARCWATGEPSASTQAVAAILAGVVDADGAKAALTALAAMPEVALVPSRQRQALSALSLAYLGRSLDGQTLTGRADPGRELLLNKALVDEAGSAALVECKSGVDRTLTMVALMCAADAVAQARPGAPFDPLDRGADLGPMRGLFGRFADGLGTDVVRLTRPGGGKIKWRSHPTPQAWYPREGHKGGPLGDFRPSKGWLARLGGGL